MLIFANSQDYYIFGLSQTVFAIVISVLLGVTLLLFLFFCGFKKLPRDSLCVLKTGKKVKVIRKKYIFVFPFVQKILFVGSDSNSQLENKFNYVYQKDKPSLDIYYRVRFSILNKEQLVKDIEAFNRFFYQTIKNEIKLYVANHIGSFDFSYLEKEISKKYQKKYEKVLNIEKFEIKVETAED